MFFLFLITSLMFLFLESTITTLPLLLTLTTVLIILYKEAWVFVLAFFGGLILDITTIRPVGITSMLLICWLFLILLYERKYTINSIPFVCLSSFFGGLIFLLIFGYDMVFYQSIIGSILALILFLVLKRRGNLGRIR